MHIKIEKIIYTGKSLARHDGKVIFTDQGLPGEVVEIDGISDKKNFSEAKTKCVLEASADRTAPRCGHYKICSPYQYMNYECQLKIKEGQLREMFSHDLKFEHAEINIRPSEKIWGYRNKIHLHIMWEGGLPFYSYHELESPTRFEVINECFLVSDKMNAFLKDVIAIIKEKKLTEITELTVRESSGGEILAGFLVRNMPKPKDRLSQIIDLLEKYNISGVVSEDMDSEKVTVVHGKGYLSEKIEGKPLMFGLDSFFQVNTDMILKVIKDIRSLSLGKGSEFIDMYCGVGTFGIILSCDFAGVKVSEVAKDNLSYLKRNIIENKIKNLRVYEGPAEQAAEVMLKSKNKVVFLDPPRKGLEKGLINAIMAAGPEKVIYLSCNPSTLTRDLKLLQKKFKVEKIFMYDFFPQTVHIECMVVLRSF